MGGLIRRIDKNDGPTMKRKKGLLLAALLATVIGVSYLSWFVNQHFVRTCLRSAHHWYVCFFDQDFDFSTDFYGMKYEGNTKNLLDRAVLFAGGFEKPVLHFLKDVLIANFSNQGIVVDVGANVGQHSMYMSRYARRVHAFEPYEPVLERFRRMIELNSIKNIVIHPVGLGNKNEKIPFFKPPEFNLGTGSFEGRFYSANTPFEELEIVIGDEALEKAGVDQVSLIKIDVEGYEKPVLQGLARTLRLYRPIVVVEVTIKPEESFGFKSKEDLRSVFPEDYDLLVFGTSIYSREIFYQLTEIGPQHRFDLPTSHEVVAYPAERKDRIPRQNF